MSAVIAEIIAELERLPDHDRETAARYIHELAAGRQARKQAMLQDTAGSLSGSEGAAFDAAIAQCSNIDENNW